MTETAKGCIVRLADGTEYAVIERFTTAVKIVREAAEPDEKDAEGKLPEPRVLTNTNDGGRIYLTPQQADGAVVCEVK